MKFTFFEKAGKGWSKWAVRLGKRAVHLTDSLICSLWGDGSLCSRTSSWCDLVIDLTLYF